MKPIHFFWLLVPLVLTSQLALTQSRPPTGGVYLGTVFNGSYLEKHVFYFAPNGVLYKKPEGADATSLARHRGEKNRYTVSGKTINIRRANGSITQTGFNPADPGSFNLDGLIMTLRKPFTRPQELVGKFDGGASISGASTSSSLQLNADGTYSGYSVTSVSTRTDAGRTDLGAQGGTSGTWRWSGWTLQFRDRAGNVSNQIVFPYEFRGAGTEMKRYMYVGEVMYTRR